MQRLAHTLVVSSRHLNCLRDAAALLATVGSRAS